MLVVYDRVSGRIHQIVTYAESGLEKIKAMHDRNGEGTLIVTDEVDIASAYVVNSEIAQRPGVSVRLPIARPIRADGADALAFAVGQHCELQISFEGEVVAREGLAPGPLPLCVEQPGEYRLKFTAEFPFVDADFVVRAE